MAMGTTKSPGHVVVFGASGRLGSAVARQIRFLSPDLKLRLITSRDDNIPALTAAFPGEEIVQANLNDEASVAASFADVEAGFLVTPNFLDETTAMGHVAAAIGANSGFRQLFRIVGDQPGMVPERLPEALRTQPGPAMQHYLAREALTVGEAPVCYLNIAALTSNLLANAPGIRDANVLAQPQRTHGWIDAGEVGEVAARLILAGDDRHLGQTYDLDNGHDVIPWSAVADIFTSVLLRRVAFDPSPAAFLKHVAPAYVRKMGFDDAADYFLEYFTWEAHHDLAWRGTDFVERVLGRRPKTLRAWIEQNAAIFISA